MRVDEFVRFTETLGVVEDKTNKSSESGLISSREIPIMFFQSMMTRVDELSTEQHLNMSEVEFIEAVARLADRAPTDDQYALFLSTHQGKPQLDPRTILAIKIYFMLQKMAKMSLGEEFAEKYAKNHKVGPIVKKL